MKTLICKQTMRLFISLTLFFAVGVPSSTAQQKIKVAGKMTAASTKQEVITVGDVEGHIISLGEYDGVHVSTGKRKFMDGAQLVIMATSDLANGNGPNEGYLKLTKSGDTVFAKWNGKITTTRSAEGSRIIALEGTFSFTNGTGEFENIQGIGIYNGKYISRTIWTGEWQGEYFISSATTKK